MFKKKDNGTVEKTKSDVAEAFQTSDLPIPQEFDIKASKKMSKTEGKIAHITLDHLYSGVLRHLRVAEEELGALSKKKPDNPLVADVLYDVQTLGNSVGELIDSISNEITQIGGVEALDDIYEKLYKEMILASALQSMPTVPQEKMH